jgi:hypothetical protein
MTRKSLIAVARRLAFVRETDGPNRGAWVEYLLRESKGNAGDPWCAAFVSFVLDVAYFGKPPLPSTTATRVLLAAARAQGWTLAAGEPPAPEDLFFYVRADGTPHHVGIVTSEGGAPLAGIAGNTSEDGRSSEGTGVFEHGLAVDPGRIVFVRIPLSWPSPPR